MAGQRNIALAWWGLTSVALGSVCALWAVGELTGGLIDLPRHWWSALAVVPLSVGVVAVAIALLRISRDSGS